MEVIANIDVAGHLKEVRSPAFWKYAASEWHRLYRPYVPFKEGALYGTVNIKGGALTGTIEHTVPYAHYMYEGRVMGPNVPIMQAKRVVGYFSPTKPKHYTGAAIHYSGMGCAHWDEAARPTQFPILIQSLQNYVNSGALGLGGK